MQDQPNPTNQEQENQVDAGEAAAGVAVARAAQNDFVRKVVEKVKDSENILLTLSKDPTVDEISAALALAMFLDGMAKHVTSIYSGKTPKAVEFLRPDVTFEKTTDSLQDFIIALDKDKADHLRYKLEGEEVRIYITPYRTTITEEDLQYSHGDYNVDFVIAVNVKSANDLDPALGDGTRVMHDAAAVNITTGEPGKFGEIEWSNPAASSLSEMMAELIFALQGQDDTLDNDVATALLAGIVAATDRFLNERTSSDTLNLASKLMSLGANQQLVSSNVAGNPHVSEAETVEGEEEPKPVEEPVKDTTSLEVGHDEPKTEVKKNPFAEPEKPGLDAMGLPTAAGMNSGSAAEAGGAAVVREDVPAAPQISTATEGVNSAGANPAAVVAAGMEVPKGPEPATFTIPGVAQREMATSAPEQATTPQEGVAVQPKEAGNEPATMMVPGMPAGAGGSGAGSADMESPSAGTAGAGSAGTAVMPGAVLPPPPAPPMAGPNAMPPSLPPVQV